MSYVPPKRKQTQTERGRLWQLEMKQGDRRKTENKLRKKMNAIQAAIDAKNEEVAREEMRAIDQLFKEFMELHARCMMLMNDDNEIFLSDSFADRVDRDVHTLKRKFYEFTSNVDDLASQARAGAGTSLKSLPANASVKSKTTSNRSSDKSSSQRTHTHSSDSSTKRKLSGSNRSSVRQAAIEERARLAELEVEQSFIQFQEEARQKEKLLMKQLEIAKSKARLRIYQDEEEDNRSQALSFIPVMNKEDHVKDFIYKHSTPSEPNHIFPERLFDQDAAVGIAQNQHLQDKQSPRNQDLQDKQSPRNQDLQDQLASPNQHLQDQHQLSQHNPPDQQQPLEQSYLRAPVRQKFPPVQHKSEGRQPFPPVQYKSEGRQQFPPVQHETEVLQQFPAVQRNSAFQQQTPPVQQDPSMPVRLQTEDQRPRRNQLSFTHSLQSIEAQSSRNQQSPQVVGTQQTANDMISLIHTLQLPDVELRPFNGNPLEFWFFMTTFEESVERKTTDETNRLLRLINSVTGEPKELIQGCLYLSPESGYKDAKRLLQEHYQRIQETTSLLPKNQAK